MLAVEAISKVCIFVLAVEAISKVGIIVLAVKAVFSLTSYLRMSSAKLSLS